MITLLYVMAIIVGELIWRVAAISLLHLFPPNRDVQIIVQAVFVALIATSVLAIYLSIFTWFLAFGFTFGWYLAFMKMAQRYN
jgi:hypothetical protein